MEDLNFIPQAGRRGHDVRLPRSGEKRGTGWRVGFRRLRRGVYVALVIAGGYKAYMHGDKIGTAVKIATEFAKAFPEFVHELREMRMTPGRVEESLRVIRLVRETQSLSADEMKELIGRMERPLQEELLVCKQRVRDMKDNAERLAVNLSRTQRELKQCRAGTGSTTSDRTAGGFFEDLQRNGR